MKRVWGGFRDFLERLYPSNPFAISFTFSHVFVLIFFAAVISGVIYLRSENKNELGLLRAEHKKIQTAITNYLGDMSEVKFNPDRQKELKKNIDEYQKKLEMVDKSIKRIRTVWFLE